MIRYTLDGPKDGRGRGHLHAQRSEIAARLDAGTRVSPDSAHRRRDQLRRHRQALRDPSRPRSPQALRHHLAAVAERHQQQQRQRRRRVILRQGPIAMNVRGIGLIGRGRIRCSAVLAHEQPLPRRALSAQRGRTNASREIRDIVVASVNNVPIRVEDLVAGGPGRRRHRRQVVRSISQTSRSRVTYCEPKRGRGRRLSAATRQGQRVPARSTTRTATPSATTTATSSGWTRKTRCRASC